MHLDGKRRRSLSDRRNGKMVASVIAIVQELGAITETLKKTSSIVVDAGVSIDKTNFENLSTCIGDANNSLSKIYPELNRISNFLTNPNPPSKSQFSPQGT